MELAPRNCVYETSDGVCFTTKAFKPESLHYYDCTGGYTTYENTKTATYELQNIGINQCYYALDEWAGAMKTCSDYGFRLPNANELASLAKDILGAKVSIYFNNKRGCIEGLSRNVKSSFRKQ